MILKERVVAWKLNFDGVYRNVETAAMGISHENGSWSRGAGVLPIVRHTVIPTVMCRRMAYF